jgi:hypothetical protein
VDDEADVLPAREVAELELDRIEQRLQRDRGDDRPDIARPTVRAEAAMMATFSRAAGSVSSCASWSVSSPIACTSLRRSWLVACRKRDFAWVAASASPRASSASRRSSSSRKRLYSDCSSSRLSFKPNLISTHSTSVQTAAIHRCARSASATRRSVIGSSVGTTKRKNERRSMVTRASAPAVTPTRQITR